MTVTLDTSGAIQMHGWYSHAFHVPQSVLYDTSFNFTPLHIQNADFVGSFE